MAALLVSHRRPGVLFPGHHRRADRSRTGHRQNRAQDPSRSRVAEIDALLYLPGHPRDALKRALRIPAFSPGWKGSLQNLLTQADSTSTSAGNTGLTAAAGSPPPAWAGFRRLESDGNSRRKPHRSLDHFGRSGRRAAAAMAARPIDRRAPRPGEDHPVTLIRNYSLSNWVRSREIPDQRQARETRRSKHIHSLPRDGRRHPRGRRTARRVLPHRRRDTGHPDVGGRRSHAGAVHAAHAGRDRITPAGLVAARSAGPVAAPFAAESRALLDQLSNGHIRVFYSRPEPADQLPADTERGRLSAAPSPNSGFLAPATCICAGRKASWTTSVRDSWSWVSGLTQIHTEIFGATTALTPGIAATAVPPHLPVGPPGTGPPGAVRPQRHNGTIGSAHHQPARIRRSL